MSDQDLGLWFSEPAGNCWQIINEIYPDEPVFESVSKRLIVEEFRRRTGIDLSDADFAEAFVNRVRGNSSNRRAQEAQ